MFLMRLWRHKDPEVGKPWSAHPVPWKGERKLWEGVWTGSALESE